MAITPRGLLVPGPQARPTSYGLFSVAQSGDTSDPHWQAGVEFEDVLCAELGSTVGACAVASPPATKEAAGGPLFRTVDPFTLIGSYACSTGGRRSEDAFNIARARLLAREEAGAERIFWTGETSDGDTIEPSLANGDADITPTDVTGGATLDPLSALAVLEAAVAGCVPGAGVLHLPVQAAIAVGADGLIRTGSGGATTLNGTQVVIGAGYPGTGPDNVAVAAGETWAFGTGQVMVWQGEAFMTPETLAEAMDRTLNDVTVYAEKTFAVGFSCCLFAVRMFLSCCVGGS